MEDEIEKILRDAAVALVAAGADNVLLLANKKGEVQRMSTLLNEEEIGRYFHWCVRQQSGEVSTTKAILARVKPNLEKN